MGDREARRQAAREAVLQARLEAERPWWRRRLFALPRRLWDWLKTWTFDLREDVFDLLLTGIALVIVIAAGLLVAWGWHTAPMPTAVFVLGVAAFLTYGGVEFFREGSRGRLALAAAAAFAFVATWAAVLLVTVSPYLLF